MGEISQFRHMLGLDTQVTSQGGHGGQGGHPATTIPPLPQNKARTMKDSKEIMKKREQAIRPVFVKTRSVDLDGLVRSEVASAT